MLEIDQCLILFFKINFLNLCFDRVLILIDFAFINLMVFILFLILN